MNNPGPGKSNHDPKDTDTPVTVDIQRLLELLPHRYPFLLIDRIKDINGTESAVGIKNLTFNEPFFQGHFPGRPVMPGALIVEAMAQTSAAIVALSLDLNGTDALALFADIQAARFRKPIFPGDQINLHVERKRQRANLWRYRGEAWVDGKLRAEAEYSAMIVSGNLR